MNLVNEAALLAARRNKRLVTQAEFEDAKDKVMMGAERSRSVMTEEEKKLTAYHEGGHAIVALNVIATDPIHKATIIPRGRALGMVMQLPERDKLSMTLEQMTSRLAVMMGGRVAEELIFGNEKVTSGASSDIEQATRLARMMVTRWGLSEELGTVSYGENQDEVFLGMSVSRTQNVVGGDRAEDRRRNQAPGRGRLQRGDADPHREARRSRRRSPRACSNTRRCRATRSPICLNGKKPNRESVLEPTTPRTSAVPPAGKPRPRPDPDRRPGAATAGVNHLRHGRLFRQVALQKLGIQPGFRIFVSQRADTPTAISSASCRTARSSSRERRHRSTWCTSLQPRRRDCRQSSAVYRDGDRAGRHDLGVLAEEG